MINIPLKNAEGYVDYTAYEAMKSIIKYEKMRKNQTRISSANNRRRSKRKNQS